jgi:hypothetical protein
MVESSARNPASRTAVDVLLAGVILAAALQQQQSLAEWRAAAAQRDRMLTEAARLADGMQCASVSVTNLPATLKGAQLFNNGFPEALREVRSKVPGIRDCRLTWSGAAFREH